MIMDGMGGDGGALMSGTGLAQVNRLVAELDRRRSRSTTPTPPVSPLDPHGHGHGGRASPSLLGPALARLADDASGGAHEYGERLLPGDALGHGHGRNSGRTSPLLPLGIAVDEVDKERRRRSEDSGVLGGVGMSVEMLLAEEDELYEDSEREGGDGEGAPRSRSATPSPKILYERAYSSSPTGFLSAAPPASAPPTSTSFPASSSITSVQLPASAIKNLKRRSFNAPVRGYVDDDDDAELFPLPSSSSRGSTPTVSPRGSPGASASEVNVVNADRNGNGKRGSPKAGALLPAVLTAAARERDVAGGSGKEGTTPPSPREKEKEKERSRSEAVCIALGTGGRREREEREREKAAKCSRGLLLPPGDGRECSDSSNSASRESSREGSVERGVARGRGGGGGSGSTSDADSERRDVDKPLPVLPHLATSVLTAGRYSPALAPRTSKAVQDAAPGQGKSSSHVRVASAPAGGSPTSSSFKLSMSPTPPTPTISTSTNTHLGRAKSVSTSSPTAPTASPPSTPPVVAAPTPGDQILACVSSFKGKRTRSSSSSS
ncbi:hypothetical protein K438DRAFT_1887549, partial [Mycena galopus ATCC 62051]